ncbi:hypothetical protein CAPTEDRAFT_143095, partial [Capitella teleta]
SQDEVRLVKHLFEDKGYNPLIRPVRNLTEKVTVRFGLAMIQLINVDEKNQIMKSNVWLRMLWNDYQLRWDPTEYGGITVIRILPDKVWKPDIVLFNNADGKYEVSYKPNVVIYSTGEVLWIPPAIYKSSCTIDVEFFPFDKQECDMKFGSWTFNGEQVTLDWYEGKQRVDLTDYVNSGTWDILNCPGEKTEEFDKDEKHLKSEIKFTLFIRRKTLFYTVNLIIPCVLISFLSVCVFYLPADAGEKMTMCISILLALVVFLLLVSKILPPTSITIPLIAKYLLFTFIMNIFTILITVVIINWNFRTPRTHRMSKWVRVVFLNYLPRILFMKRPNHNDRWAAKTYSRIGQTASSGSPGMPNTNASSNSGNAGDLHMPSHGPQYSSLNSRHADFMELSEMQHAPNCKMKANRRHGDGRLGGGDMGTFHMTPETHKAIEAVRFIAAHLKNEDDYAEILEDWRYIAMVIDRLMLYIFLAVTIGGTVGILINAPNIFDYVDQKAIIDSLKDNN